MNERSKRRKFLIDPSFQMPFIYYTVGIALTVSGIFFAASRYFLWKFRQQGLEIGLSSDHAFFRFLNDQRTTLDLTLLGASLVVVALLVSYGLFISNRVAGPIYHLKKHLREFCSGKEFSDIQFREKDFFPELAESVNEAIRHAKK